MKHYMQIVRIMGVLTLLALAVGSVAAQGSEPPHGATNVETIVGNAFTYQGRLTDGGSPANGAYDFVFKLYDAASGGSQVNLLTVSKNDVMVANGLFTVELDFTCFGFVPCFTGDARWLEIGVRPGSSTGSYTTLSPRQAINAVPYAISLKPGAKVTGMLTSPVFRADNTATGGVGAADGIWGMTASSVGKGVLGSATAISGTTYGVNGWSFSPDGFGVYGRNDYYNSFGYLGGGDHGGGDFDPDRSIGVYGQSNEYGVYGETTTTGGFRYAGVYGRASATNGIGYGVLGATASPDGYAGYFLGPLGVESSGNFNHPQFAIKQIAADFARLRMHSSITTTRFWDIAVGPNSSEFRVYFNPLFANVLRLTPEDATNLLVMSNGARLTAGGAWTNASDRNVKANFESVSTDEMLKKVASLPIQTWNYKAEDVSVRHIGPTAQDFYAAFGVGGNDKSISTVDADGVALAAIQGLYQIVEQKDQQLARLQQQVDQLQTRLSVMDRDSSSSPFAASALFISGALTAGLGSGLIIYRARKGLRR